jgi:xanthine dehydrogenase accessory factor
MREVLPEIKAWQAAGKRVAIATVVSVWGSAPRPVGSRMAISSANDMAGSVSGGCVEGAVFEEAQGVLATGEPKLVSFGVDDELAWSVGLSCGGHIEIFIDLWGGPLDDDLEAALAAERLIVFVRAVAGELIGARSLFLGDEWIGSLHDPSLDSSAAEQARAQLGAFSSRRHDQLFVEVLAPRPVLFVVGAVHVAIPLVHMAKLLGMKTVVIDPRTAFATPERFPHADVVSTAWPDEALRLFNVHENSFVALLSHDLKLDVPAVKAALAGRARYIGALGSQKTQQKRVAALRAADVDEAGIARLHNPIGLDLGGRRAEEIAVAVIAQIVGVSNGRDVK